MSDRPASNIAAAGGGAGRVRGSTVVLLSFFGTIVVLFVGIFVPAREAVLTSTSGEIFGTTYSVKMRWSDSSNAFSPAAIALMEQELDRLDAIFSTWRDDSEVAAFNRHESTRPISASNDLHALVADSVRLSKRVDGAFDITATLDRPASGTIESDPEAGTIRKTRPGLTIDMSAIAKGYAVDRLAATIERARPLTGYLVEIGGEIRVRGTWTIGIEAPDPNDRRIMHTVRLTDAALATSGDYRNFTESDGKRYPHIIDPRTGSPVDHNLASASAIAATCAEADALATALMVMGPTEARAFAERERLPVLLITRRKDGDGVAVFASWASPHWPR